MFCSKCGCENPEGSVFCKNCGGKITPKGPAPVNTVFTSEAQNVITEEIKDNLGEEQQETEEKTPENAKKDNGKKTAFIMMGIIIAIFGLIVYCYIGAFKQWVKENPELMSYVAKQTTAQTQEETITEAATVENEVVEAGNFRFEIPNNYNSAENFTYTYNSKALICTTFSDPDLKGLSDSLLYEFADGLIYYTLVNQDYTVTNKNATTINGMSAIKISAIAKKIPITTYTIVNDDSLIDLVFFTKNKNDMSLNDTVLNSLEFIPVEEREQTESVEITKNSEIDTSDALKFIDEYKAFSDEYANFMEKYKKGNHSFAMRRHLTSKYADYALAATKVDTSKLSKEDYNYFYNTLHEITESFIEIYIETHY